MSPKNSEYIFLNDENKSKPNQNTISKRKTQGSENITIVRMSVTDPDIIIIFFKNPQSLNTLGMVCLQVEELKFSCLRAFLALSYLRWDRSMIEPPTLTLAII